MAKVSIVIPVYNVEKYLRECLNSVQQQTLKDIEIICIDDGSTDSSSQILDEYASNDSRFCVVHKQNEGYGKSMNKGIAMASAPYIGIVESDDMISPVMFEILYSVMEREKVDFVKSDFYEIYRGEEGKYIEEYVSLITDKCDDKLYEKAINIHEHEEILRLISYTWNGLYSREFLEKECIIYNETPGASYQDIGFWFQTMVKSKSLYITKDAYYKYRIDNVNASMYSKEKVFTVFEEYDFLRKILNKMGEQGKPFYKWTYYLAISNGIGNISRVADEYKKDLIDKIKNEFYYALQKELITPNIYPDYIKIKIFDIISDPQKYCEKEIGRRNKIENALKAYDVIILYGTGIIGYSVQARLKEGRLNTKIKYFAVSKCENSYQFVKGIPVKEISDLKEYAKTAAVIVAVSPKYQQEIVDILKKNQFAHYILMDEIF